MSEKPTLIERLRLRAKEYDDDEGCDHAVEFGVWCRACREDWTSAMREAADELEAPAASAPVSAVPPDRYGIAAKLAEMLADHRDGMGNSECSAVAYPGSCDRCAALDAAINALSSPPLSASVDAPSGPECTCAQRYSYRDAPCPTHGAIAPSASGEGERQERTHGRCLGCEYDRDYAVVHRQQNEVAALCARCAQACLAAAHPETDASLSALRSALTALVETLRKEGYESAEAAKTATWPSEMGRHALRKEALVRNEIAERIESALASAVSGDAGTGAEASNSALMTEQAQMLRIESERERAIGYSYIETAPDAAREYYFKADALKAGADAILSLLASSKAGPA